MKMPHPRKKHTRANHASRPTAMLAGVAVLSLAAVAQGQSVVGWGSNTTNNTPLPAPADLTSVRNIDCGAYHTAAVLPDGTARFWGTNTSGQCSALPAFVQYFLLHFFCNALHLCFLVVKTVDKLQRKICKNQSRAHPATST